MPRVGYKLIVHGRNSDMASHPIYQFYAELDDFKPKIWRRFQVSNDVTIARLGYIVQVLFEMTASHLMAVEVPSGENMKKAWRREHPDDDSSFIMAHTRK